MNGLLLQLKKFCADEIVKQDLRLPVRIAVYDLGANPVYEMVASSVDDGGSHNFSDERLIEGTLSRPAPWTIRLEDPTGRALSADFQPSV